MAAPRYRKMQRICVESSGLRKGIVIIWEWVATGKFKPMMNVADLCEIEEKMLQGIVSLGGGVLFVRMAPSPKSRQSM